MHGEARAACTLACPCRPRGDQTSRSRGSICTHMQEHHVGVGMIGLGRSLFGHIQGGSCQAAFRTCLLLSLSSKGGHIAVPPHSQFALSCTFMFDSKAFAPPPAASSTPLRHDYDIFEWWRSPPSSTTLFTLHISSKQNSILPHKASYNTATWSLQRGIGALSEE